MRPHIVAVFVYAILALASCNKTDHIVVNQIAAQKAATVATQSITVSAEKNHSQPIHKETKNTSHTTAKEVQQPKPTNDTEFKLAEDQHQQINIEKELAQIHKSNKQWQGNPELAEEVQRQGQLQQQKYEQEIQEEQNQLKPWIAEQLQTLKDQNDEIVTQSVQFILDTQSQYSFRWDPPKTQQLSLSVLVFSILQNGQIMMQHELEEDEYIVVEYREEGKHIYTPLGRVYVSKMFRINFDTDFKYFRFVSKLPKSVLLVVDLEKLNEVVPNTVAKDQHFISPLQKLNIIQEEILSGEKIREHTYKYEWGFLDNQYSHDSRLLGFTGLELLVIIIAAVAQLYFIKSLLDNRAIV